MLNDNDVNDADDVGITPTPANVATKRQLKPTYDHRDDSSWLKTQLDIDGCLRVEEI